MRKHFNCVGFGICATDYLCLVPKYPELDEKTEAVEFSLQGGGPCATAMVTLARLGFQSAFIGKIGADGEGRFVTENFRNNQVNVDGLILSKNMPTNKAFIWIDKRSGKKSIVLDSHQYEPVEVSELDLSFIGSADYVLLDGRDTEATFAMIAWAKNKEIPIVLDAGSTRNQTERLLKEIDYPILSQTFCHQYFTGQSYEKIIEKLLKMGSKAAVITLGERGCVGGDESGIYFQKAIKVKVVDTTGAGDVFHGAFIAGLLQGLDLKENLKFSNCVAALKCEHLGGQKGIPDMETVLNFMRSIDS